MDMLRAVDDPVVRKGLLSVFDQGVVSGTSFVTSVLIGRLCGKADLGGLGLNSFSWGSFQV